MPGFSQASYNKAHGFKFDSILEHIRHNISVIRNSGFSGKFYIPLHIYRYNIDELKHIQSFAKSLRVSLYPTLAHPNSMEYYFMYTEGTLSAEVKEKMLSELFFAPPEILKQIRPSEYECPQWQYLTLTWQGNLSLCCCCRQGKESDLTHITEINPEDSYAIRRRHRTCIKCSDLGLDYYFNNPHCYKDYLVQCGKTLEAIFSPPPQRRFKNLFRAIEHLFKDNL
jgi:hypothetical protein